jgi:hypothetical protein
LFGSPLAQLSRPVFGHLSFAGATGSAGMVTASYAYTDISEHPAGAALVPHD